MGLRIPTFGRIDAGLRRELIRDSAVPLLVLRVAEGLGAWIVFDAVYLSATRQAWIVHAALAIYFVANLGLALNYVRG